MMPQEAIAAEPQKILSECAELILAMVPENSSPALYITAAHLSGLIAVTLARLEIAERRGSKE